MTAPHSPPRGLPSSGRWRGLRTFEFWARRRPVVAGPAGHDGETVRVRRTYSPGRPSDDFVGEDVRTRHRPVTVRLGAGRCWSHNTAVYDYDRSEVEVA